MADLFSKSFPEEIHLDMDDASVILYPNFITLKDSEIYFQKLLKETPWQQDDIKVFGKTYAQPRLTALYADNYKPYSYSNITMHPLKFTPVLKTIKENVEEIAKVKFTTCLLNLYRDGNDSNGWHADDERELGKNPIIASVSLGTDRIFKFRKKDDKKETVKIVLKAGSLLIMKDETQHHWQHQIPKTKRQIGARINLTFRIVH